MSKAHADLLPEWMAPGPTVYRTLMEDAMREVLVDGGEDFFVRYVSPANHEEALRHLHERLSRVYVRGVATGYEQAGRAFDSRTVEPVETDDE